MTDYHAIYAEGKPPVVPCPVCGAPPELRLWLKYGTGQSIDSPLRSIFSLLPPVKPLVCTSCGYVQSFVDPKEVRQ